MKLIVGLGNPGLYYKNTKHNAGFWVVDKVARLLKGTFNRRKFNAHWAQGKHKNRSFIIIKPLTFMNLSGSTVKNFADYFKVTHEDILIIFDDISLKLGDIRLKAQGGAGGHKGMRSVIDAFGTNNFARLRFGIYTQKAHKDLSQYVLSAFKEKEDVMIRDKTLDLAAEAVLDWFDKDINFAMNRHNERRREISNHE
ncbi:MAG: aminoacyl-tRNA hydrolase [Candidatus Omnitrophica bacterium]|nr:aminoacyl-tRNA hydrolase [Candidatus Omnitrophota bacterium]